MPKGRFAKDLTGQTFGLLTVARRAPNYISKTGQEAVWHCRCECGNELDVRAGQLRSGHTKSCGCFQKKAAAKSSTVHGGAATKLYGVWSSMKHRCTNPHDKRFKDYGGRGITVCQEWLHDFSAFQTWALSNGYQEGLTIDRINNERIQPKQLPLGYHEGANGEPTPPADKTQRKRGKTTMTIPEQVDAYRALLDEKDRLAEETKANNRAIEAARDALATAMIEDETPQITRNGYSYTLTPKTKYSKAAGKDAELMDALRSNGLGDLIKETVNAQSLQGAMSNLAEENDDELPEEFEGLVNVYSFNDITRRKSSRKQ